MNAVDKWLDKAVDYEQKYFDGDETAKKKANMAFRRAVNLESGKNDFSDDVLK